MYLIQKNEKKISPAIIAWLENYNVNNDGYVLHMYIIRPIHS